MKILKRFRKKKSIYKVLIENNFNLNESSEIKLSDGSYELSIAKGNLKINYINTKEINKAVDDYYVNKKEAIDEFEKFLKIIGQSNLKGIF